LVSWNWIMKKVYWLQKIYLLAIVKAHLIRYSSVTGWNTGIGCSHQIGKSKRCLIEIILLSSTYNFLSLQNTQPAGLPNVTYFPEQRSNTNLWFGYGKFPLKISNFQFFPYRVKKISLGRLKKYPDQRQVASYLLRVKSMLGSGQAHLYHKPNTHIITSLTLLFCFTP